MSGCILALDQGTTSSRAILFGRDGHPLGVAQQEYEQIYPRPSWVEHDPEAIWSSQLKVAQDVIKQTDIDPADIAALGLTNQRETTILWERDTGKPVANAIVWQSRVTSKICSQLKADGHEDLFRDKTGLVIDAYFSGTKIKHLLDTIDGLRERAERGEILFGTVDSFLIWRLTGGRKHVTDYSNASRTLIYNIHTLDWDDELLELLDIPRAMLPEVIDSSGVVAETEPELFGRPIPIAGIAGDQQAATFGQGCFEVGDAKNTYGTGCFMLLNTGSEAVKSEHGLLTTIGWGIDGQVTYCLEGAIFVAGAVVQWLRDGLKMIESAPDIEPLAGEVPDTGGVMFVPAFTGVGAPHWNQGGRGMILGITRGTTQAHIARAALESMAFQTRDVLDAMTIDSGVTLQTLKVDGGASANNLMLQFQADLLGVPVHRPVVQETTALGAAYLAGLAVGFWNDRKDLLTNWALDQEFQPKLGREDADRMYAQWKNAVTRCFDWEE
ncbi:glycerol kinase GlpK [Thalassoroseus pseudoceratinae]|uniref:glycerol kinase GlpK n=1 Tax=Thalassoroseus pseudoceratinae TaxID=2713176 RepID=UPI001423ED97|nr:glycerol kinase GlpK [Thalassoroseus pseudoceratinae]